MLTDQPRRRRARYPECWLMTDSRLGDARAIARIIAAMPPRSGIVIRPYALAGHSAVRAILRVSQARRHCVLVASAGPLHGARGRHAGRGVRHAQTIARAGEILSMPVHDAGDARRARSDRADICFISPLFATQSHPGAPVLGARGFARLAAACPGWKVALGGMDARRFRPLRCHGAHGWAAIDAWRAINKRKA